MPAPIAIVIPAFNQLDYCRQCIASLKANTAREHTLILVDNGSTDGVGEYFDSVPGAVVIHAGANLGFAGGVNLGLRRAEGHALVLNSDTLLPQGWLERLEPALLRDDRLGMVGPMSNCVSGLQQIDGLEFNSLDQINAYADDLARAHDGVVDKTDRLVGFCLLIRDQVLRSVGLFDERFGIGNFEDDDYGLRVRRAGYHLGIARDCFVFHYGSRTFTGMGMVGDAWKTLMSENEARFHAKWTEQNAAEAEALDAEARQVAERGDPAEALRLLTAALERAPGYAVIHNDLGAVLWQLGQPERALASFERALALRPDYPEAQRNRDQARLALNAQDNPNP